MSKRRAIPYTVIGGYLGAGKTTLLNYLLRNSQGLRLAVLVNDFGEINIDADLIASHDGETINLASGCICCSLVDGFMTALNQISKRTEQIDHIVVEASGVSNPVKIGQYGAILNLRLDGIIVLADAEQVRDKAANKYVGDTVIRQLQGADLLVLNKVDLVSTEDLVEVRDWLVDLAPDVRIVEATYGEVPLAVLLGAYDREQPEGAFDHDHDQEDGNHQSEYQTWTLTSEKPLSRVDLQAILDRLPAEVLRAKGYVFLDDDQQRRYILQLVGKRWSLEPSELWGNDLPQTQLVFIALSGSEQGSVAKTVCIS